MRIGGDILRGIDAAERSRKHARRKSGFPHGQNHGGNFWMRSGQFQHADVVRLFLGRRNNLVSVRRDAQHTAEDGIHGRGSAVVVIREQQVSPSAKRLQLRHAVLRAFNFDIDRLRARGDRVA